MQSYRSGLTELWHQRGDQWRPPSWNGRGGRRASRPLVTAAQTAPGEIPATYVSAPRGVLALPLLLVLILAGMALRLYQLGAGSLWYDETVSLLLAQKSVPALIAHTARDIHPPFYYMLLHWWTNLVGPSEFAAAFLSLWFGVLLIPATWLLARCVVGPRGGIPLIAAFLVTISPFHIWYSQEVRMYTLGALLGVLGHLAGWRLWRASQESPAAGAQRRRRSGALLALTATVGMYTLYYYAFLLVWQALFFGGLGLSKGRPRPYWTALLVAGATTLLLWAPWVPVAYRQATDPPVPPWRSALTVQQMVWDGVGALTWGQAAPIGAPFSAPPLVWVAGGVAVLGGWGLWRQTGRAVVPLFVVGAVAVPAGLIIGLTVTTTPLFHVRYLFPYAPPFSILMAAGLWTLASAGAHLLQGTRDQGTADQEGAQARGLISRQRVALPLLGLLLLWVAPSTQSLVAFWHSPTYAADDFRGALGRLEGLWRAGDVLLVNAGYVYPAVNYYFQDPIVWQGRLRDVPRSSLPELAPGLIVAQTGSIGAPPSLGWGRAESDFYATTAAESETALAHLASRHQRVWLLRVYDTVTDPNGVLRAWLATHGRLFYDEQLTGESNARLQGWLFPAPPLSATAIIPMRPLDARLGEALAISGARLLSEAAPYRGATQAAPPPSFQSPLGTPTVAGGARVHLQALTTLLGERPATLRLSVGLFDGSGHQWYVLDEAPIGPTLPLNTLAAGTVAVLPFRLDIPVGLPPGPYEVRLKAYTAEGALPVQGDSAASPDQVRLAVLDVVPTPPGTPLPPMGIDLQADMSGRLRLRGATLSSWHKERNGVAAQPGDTISVELLWEAGPFLGPDESLRPVLSLAQAPLTDDGGVVLQYPTQNWAPGQLVRDLHRVTLPPDLAPGQYRLQLAIERGAGGAGNGAPGSRLQIQGPGLQRGELLTLATITVQDRPRALTRPIPPQPLTATFPPAIALIGITPPPTQTTPGASVPLTLFWHALERPTGRYKIFTHLVGPDGQLYGQRDLEPGEGTLPTNGWVAGEYVTTSLTIPLDAAAPVGLYEVRVGLYDPVSGARVIPQGEGAIVNERYLSVARIEIK